MSVSRTGAIGVFTIDRELVVRSWDSWLADATGIAERDATGRALAELFPDLEQRGLLARLRHVVETGSADVLASALHAYFLACAPRTPSAHFMHMQQHVSISAMRAGSHVVGVAVTIEDVTVRRDRERELARKLESLDDAVRLEAVRTLATADEREAAMLAGALGDDSWRVRRAAADGMARGHDDATRDALLTAVRERHRDPAVLNAALTALINAEQDVVPPLVTLLSAADSDAEVRTYTTLALGLLHDARAVGPLVHALGDVDANVRFHAVEALGRIRSRAAALPVAIIAESRDFSVAFAALETLSLIGEPSVAPRLVPLLDDDLLETAAAEALGRLGNEDVIGPLLALVQRAPSTAASVAGALAALSARLDRTGALGEGGVAGLARTVATPDAARAFVNALPSASDSEVAGLVSVIGALRLDGIEDTLTSALARPAARAPAAEVLASRGAAAVEPLLRALATGDEDVRMVAATTLGRLGATAAVPALIALLAEDTDIAVAAASALGAIGDERALASLLALLDRPEAAVRQAAVAALSSIGHPALHDTLAGLFGHQSPRVREGAARVAGYVGDARSVEPLVALAGDSDEGVRRTAIEQLAHLDDPRALRAMRNALATGTSGVRAAAVRALAHVPASDALPFLIAACDDHDPWVRYYAARSLGHLGQADAVAMLVQLATSDPVPPVRIAAVEALAELRAPDGFPALQLLATDGDAGIARQALFALGHSDDPRAVAPLLEALQRDRELQLAALDALGRFGATAIVAAVAPLAAHGADAAVRDAAFNLLAKLGSEDAVSAIIGIAADPQRTARAVDALADVGKADVWWLSRGLAHDDPAVRCAVVEALGRIERQAAEPLLVGALDDADEGVRMAAAHALTRRDLRAARVSAAPSRSQAARD